MDFLIFDKYAAHVWTVYSLGFLLIIVNAYMSRAQLKKTQQKVLRRLQAEASRNSAKEVDV